MANLQSFERTDYQQVKADLHRKILDRLDLEKLGKAAGDCRARRSPRRSFAIPSTARSYPSALPSANGCRGKSWMKSSVWARSSRC